MTERKATPREEIVEEIVTRREYKGRHESEPPTKVGVHLPGQLVKSMKLTRRSSADRGRR